MRIAGLVLSLLFVLSSVAQAAELKPEEVARLEKGEVIVQAKVLGDEGTVVAGAMVLMDFAPERIWRHIDDCGRYDQFMPRVSKSTEIVREGAKVICRVEIDMPFPMSDLWSETDARHDQPDPDTFRRRWKLGKGTYRVNEGHWTISRWKDSPERALVKYRIKVQPEAKMPGAMLKEAQRRSLPEMMEALRKRTADTK